MQTAWISRTDVEAYGRDLAQRLLLSGHPPPEVWCAITLSGFEFVDSLLSVFGEVQADYAAGVDLWPLGWLAKEPNVLVRYDLQDEPPERQRDLSGLAGRRVLLLDSAIHSGHTFEKIYSRIVAEKPAQVITYSLVVKCSSAFYPTYWGCTIRDQDRALFLLDTLPNNRLTSGTAQKTYPAWSLRRLSAADLDRPTIKSKVDSIDRVTWHDRYYSMSTNEQGLATFLCEIGSEIAGFVTFHYSESRFLVIDEVVTDERFRGAGLGGALLRFLETCARQVGAPGIRMWAIEGRVRWYKDYGYEEIPGEPVVKLGEEVYKPMQKTGLYRTYYTHPGH